MAPMSKSISKELQTSPTFSG